MARAEKREQELALAGRSVCETLESRMLLSVGMDPNGWSTFTPSADTRIVYVSSSQGSDANSGLSPDAPVQSIPAAMKLLRPGMPDWVLFKRGDVWNRPVELSWGGDGRSASEPKLLGAYGTGPRPILYSDAATPGGTTGTGVFLLSGARPIYAAIVGLDLEATPQANAAKAPTGISLLSSAIQDVLVENCVIRGFANGIVAQGYAGTLHNVAIRRNIIADNYSNSGHSQGMYVDNVDGFTLDGNLFDHNGWNTAEGASPTIFNHNVYVKENVSGVLIHDNIFANASSHGLQARSGGIVRNNLFINNAIGMSFGYVNGSPATSGGVEGEVSGNVFLGGRDIAGSPRGWALEVSNTKPGAHVAIRNNIFAHEPQKVYGAIHLDYGNLSNPADAVGINDLSIEDNTIYDWAGGIEISSRAQLGGSGQYALNGLSVTNNDFQVTKTIIQHAPAFNAAQETWANNRYDTSGTPWFSIQNISKSWDAWHGSIDPTGSASPLAYPDPARSIAAYSAALGGAASTDAFLAQARQQSASNWLPQYTASAAIDYIRQGFAMTVPAGVTVTPTSGLVTSESGATASFLVMLNTRPAAAVTIPLASSDPTEGVPTVTSLTFTPDNWNIAQRVTVAGIPDGIADGHIAYRILTGPAASADPDYNGFDPDDVSFINADTSAPAGITVNPISGLITNEAGATASFQIVLNSRPAANVTIALSSSDNTEGKPSLSSITFTPDNWNAPQTIIVTGMDDTDADGNIAYKIYTGAAASADPNYRGLNPPDVSLLNLDNETTPPAIRITRQNGITTESGGTAAFQVSLATQPAADVVLRAMSSDPTEGDIAAPLLRFTPANWNTPQTLVVAGIDDAMADGTVPYTVSLTATSADPLYSGLRSPDLALVNLDDDAPGILLSRTSGLITTEAAGTASFDVHLASQPTADVLLTFASTNPAEGTLLTPVLRFTPDNWDVPQTVLIAGVDDAIDDGDVAYAITSAAASVDPLYNGIGGAGVSITNVSNDVAGILVTPPAEPLTSETGRSAMFTVQLRTQPVSDVVIPLGVSDDTEATLSATQLVFTPANWNIPQSFWATGLADALIDGSVPYNVTIGPALSEDRGYVGLSATDIAMTNLDTRFSAVPYSGDAAHYSPLTPARWSITQDGGDVRYFLNSSDYAAQPGGRLGEYSLLNKVRYGDFYFDLSARAAEDPIANPSTNYAIIFGFLDSQNYSYLLMTPSARTTMLRTVSNGVARTVAYSVASGFADNSYHNIEIARSGSTVRVLRDGKAILSATDARLGRAGQVGIGSFDGSAYFDDISVAPPSQPLTAVLSAPAVLLSKQATMAPAAATAGTSRKHTARREQYVFSVTYIPNTYPRSIRRVGNGDVYVTGAHGFKQSARLLARRPGPVRGSIIADYAITPPGGSWDAGDKGKYTISLAGNHVSDAKNRFAAAQTLGAFAVGFPTTRLARSLR